MHRFLLGVVVGIGISVLVTATGVLWPEAGPSPAAAVQPPAAMEAASHSTSGRRLTVHRPVPHPALIAAAELFVSLYVLVADQKQWDESAV